MPKVSVIIPAFNSARFIAETLDSVFAQTHKDLEVIVVNDGSTDNTEEALSPYRSRIKYIFQENQGAAAARNRAIQESAGEYIAFIDADDVWLPAKIEKQLAVFKQNPDLGFVCTATYVIDEHGRVTAEWKKPKWADCTFECLYGQNFIFNLSVMAKRACIDSVKGLDPSLKISQDYDLWLRLARNNKFYYLDELLAKYRKHNRNISRNYSWWMKDQLRVLSKPELRAHLTGKEFYLRLTKNCIYLAEHAAKEKRYFISARFYFQALFRMPYIGKYYRTPEYVGRPGTTAYRIMKIYYLVGQSLVLGVKEKFRYA